MATYWCSFFLSILFLSFLFSFFPFPSFLSFPSFFLSPFFFLPFFLSASIKYFRAAIFSTPGHRMTSHFFTISRLHTCQENPPPPPLVNLVLQHRLLPSETDDSRFNLREKHMLTDSVQPYNKPIIDLACSVCTVTYQTSVFSRLIFHSTDLTLGQ